MAIFAASAAALRPLLKHIPILWGSMYGHSHDKSHNSNSDATGPYHVFDAAYEMNRRMSNPQSQRLEAGHWSGHGKGVPNERIGQVYHVG